MNASSLVTFGIPAVAVALALAFLVCVKKAAPESFAKAALATIAWFALWGALAASGVLAKFDARPPPTALMFVGILVGGIGLGTSKLGKKLAVGLPLWALIAVQGFRLPLELVMHQAAAEGTMPNQMTFSGLNFDIITGTTAPIVALLLSRGAPRSLAFAWNVLGSVLLLAIAVIAIASLPMFSAFGADAQNRFVAYFPFIYLPTVCVTGALAGHILIFRKLRETSSSRQLSEAKASLS